MAGKKLILPFFFFFSLAAAFAQPANDACAGAIVIAQDSTCTAGTLVSATDNIASCVGCQGPNCNNHRDVWYTFIASGTAYQYSITNGTLVGNIEVVIISATGVCAGLAVLDSKCGASPMTDCGTGLTIGNRYYILVSAPGNATGTFTICFKTSIPAGGTTNCSGATQVCSNAAISGNSSGFGVQELNAGNRGCLATNEHQSSWFLISIGTTGTLQMNIAPVGSDDYDFAVWGPNPACPPATGPIRCSYASGTGSTGINSTNNAPQTDNSEGATGNKWVQDMNVIAGELYLVCVDNFQQSCSPFNLNWGGTSTLSCVLVPIELSYLKGSQKGMYNFIEWQTATETNNDYFTLERSSDGIHFEEIKILPGSGTTSLPSYYSFQDHNFTPDAVNYYRLSQTDHMGFPKISGMVSVNNSFDNRKVVRVVDLLGREVDPKSSGTHLFIFEDGSYVLRSVE